MIKWKAVAKKFHVKHLKGREGVFVAGKKYAVIATEESGKWFLLEAEGGQEHREQAENLEFPKKSAPKKEGK